MRKVEQSHKFKDGIDGGKYHCTFANYEDTYASESIRVTNRYYRFGIYESCGGTPEKFQLDPNPANWSWRNSET